MQAEASRPKNAITSERSFSGSEDRILFGCYVRAETRCRGGTRGRVNSEDVGCLGVVGSRRVDISPVSVDQQETSFFGCSRKIL